MDEKQKVLIVHNYYQIPGGEDTVVANEKKLLEDHGYEVILYSRNNAELRTMSKAQKVLLPFTTVFSLKTYREVKRTIKEEHIDIVHVHNTLNLISPSVYYAAFSCKVPVVQTIHNFRLLCPGATFYRDGHICEDCVEHGLGCAVKHSCYRGSKLQTLMCVITTKIHRVLGTYGKLNYICLTEFNRQKLLQLKQVKPEKVFAYTFKCVVPGITVHDETILAAHYCEECGLEHRVVEVYWEDFEKYADVLMKHKGAPIHSIEIQIYKAALQAKEDGFDRMIFGETADINYGGMSKLMSRDWTFGEFVNRYSYVMPYMALKDYTVITEPFKKFVDENGYIDVHEFLRTFTLRSSMGSYENACQMAGIDMKSPYLESKMAIPLDYDRIRAGENKYLIREIFSRLYVDYQIPEKLPMPRPMKEWLSGWNGPEREEFWPHCTDNMDGDQRWLVWCLERFLNNLDVEE